MLATSTTQRAGCVGSVAPLSRLPHCHFRRSPPGRVFTDTPPPHGLATSGSLRAHIVASLVVGVNSLGVTPDRWGSPSGYTSDRSGRPSSNRRGISRVLLFVEQSIAAAMKITSSRWLLRDCCLLSSARSWLGSKSQSTVRQRHPQLHDEGFGMWGVGVRHKVGHKRSPLLRL